MNSTFWAAVAIIALLASEIVAYLLLKDKINPKIENSGYLDDLKFKVGRAAGKPVAFLVIALSAVLNCVLVFVLVGAFAAFLMKMQWAYLLVAVLALPVLLLIQPIVADFVMAVGIRASVAWKVEEILERCATSRNEEIGFVIAFSLDSLIELLLPPGFCVKRVTDRDKACLAMRSLIGDRSDKDALCDSYLAIYFKARDEGSARVCILLKGNDVVGCRFVRANTQIADALSANLDQDGVQCIKFFENETYSMELDIPSRNKGSYCYNIRVSDLNELVRYIKYLLDNMWAN